MRSRRVSSVFVSSVLALSLGLSGSCGPRNHRPGAELRAEAPQPAPSPTPSPTPPATPAAAPQCPEPPAVVARMSEHAQPAWSTGLRIVRCPQDACAGYESCFCDERGRMISRTSHAREYVIFDEQGRPGEALLDDTATARRAHLIYFYGSGCTVQGFDLDDDTFLDRVCRRCDRGSGCQECAPVQMKLRSPPCAPGVCPASFSRCGCDAQGRVVEAVSDPGHYRQITTYDGGGRVIDVSVFRGDTRLSQDQTVFDDRGRVVARIQRQGDATTTVRTEWMADGSRREIAKSGDVQIAETYYDLSKPGQETVTQKTTAGTTTRTTLKRQDDGRPLFVELTPPLTERWISCQDSKDCAVVTDDCECDRAYYVSRRYEHALRGHIARACKTHGPVPCPAVVLPPPGPPRCVQNLCVP